MNAQLYTMTAQGPRQLNIKPDYLPASKVEITDMEAVRSSLNRARMDVLAYIVKLEDRGRMRPGKGTSVIMRARRSYDRVLWTVKERQQSSVIAQYYNRLDERLQAEYDALTDMFEAVLRLNNDMFSIALDTYYALLEDDVYVN
ncbi:hypothetical protein ACE1TI_07460 [Alteribacillus sp. JSM 102045]|uniref:hypothetical protein n=1 Tax=Alteribacillus sp. JSM 102045 TaxID=1562101 RepID=UPI0035BED314